MLNISLEIHDTNKDAETRARAVVVMLHHLFGDVVLPYPMASKRVGEIELKGPVDVIFPKEDGQTDELAIDGRPVETEETDAATAFGAAPVTTTTGDVERDKDGIPWDERIHASTKTKVAAGTWTRRRNTPDAEFDAVMQELKAANTQRTVQAAAGLIPPPPPATTGGAIPLPPSAVVPTTPAPAPSQTPADTGASSTAPAANTFPLIMKKITEAQTAQKIDKPTLDGFLELIGAPKSAAGAYSLAVLAKAENVGLIPALDALLTDHIG